MAALGALDTNVEVNNSTGGGGFTILADDNYELEIIESDVKANSKATGQNLDFKVQVVSGEHKGVTFFDGISSIQHESSQAQAIAQGRLKALSEACGVDFTTLTESEQLHFKPFWAEVRSETYYSNKYKENRTKNVIGRFLYEGMPDGEETPPSAPPPEKGQPSAPPPANTNADSAKKKRPWEK
jgi:hypothetical protein